MRHQEPLPPLHPELYLAYICRQEGRPGPPLTVSEFAFLVHMTVKDTRKSVLGMAAFARKLARLERMGYPVARWRADADERIRVDREAF